MAGEENIKLGCFQLAVDMGSTSETIIEDRSLLPTRWSAPETIKLSISTPKTDVYMFGHLKYEILSHGVLPYSHENISDVDCVTQIFHSSIKLKHEKCIQQDHFRTIEDCTQFYPRHRPSIKQIRSKIENYMDSAKSEPIYPQWYPNLTIGSCKPSTEFKRGLPDLDATITPMKCITKINETLSQYKMGNTYLMREIVLRDISKEMIEKVHSGILDYMIPRIIITPYINNEYIIDIHVPCSCSSMLEFVSDQKNGCTVDTCILLLLKVVEMVQHFHELSFVLGDIRLSLIYVEKRDGDFKLYPVSLRYLCYKPGRNSTIDQLKPPYQSVTFTRAAPELKEKGVCNPTSDIFNIGALMRDVFAALNSDIEFQTEDCLNYNSLAEIMESDISADLTKPLQCPTTLFNLMKNCMHVKPRKRPTTEHIISVLEREANMTSSQLNPFNPSDSSSSDTSSFVYVPIRQRRFQVMNPSDTYAGSSDDTFCYHDSVDSLNIIYNEVDDEDANKKMFRDIYIEPTDCISCLEKPFSSQTLPKIIDETIYCPGKDSSHSFTPEIKSGEAGHKLNTTNYYLDPKSRLSEIPLFPSDYMKHRPLPDIPDHANQSLTAKVPGQHIYPSPKPHLVGARYDHKETFIKTPFSTAQNNVNTTQNLGADGKEAYIPMALFVTPVENAIPHKLIPYQMKGYIDLNPFYMAHNTAPQYLYNNFQVSSVPALSFPDVCNTDLNSCFTTELCPQHPNDRAQIQNSGEFSGPSRTSGEFSGTSRNSREFSGTSRKSREFSGTSRNYGEFIVNSRNYGEFSGTSRNYGEFSGTSRNYGEFSGTSRNSGEFNGTSRNSQEPLEASQNASVAELADLSECVAENGEIYV